MGCFGAYGWAWNVKSSVVDCEPVPILGGSKEASLPSVEFIESFLIFFYGSTNVFLEHLAAWGQAWSSQDLEHVSISLMFFGGGLVCPMLCNILERLSNWQQCGMLVESQWVRGLLHTTILLNSTTRVSTVGEVQEIRQAPKTYAISLNPLPSLVILLLGVMMSSHHQESMVSTMLHKQWGKLLVASALARAVTFLLSYLSPHEHSQLPYISGISSELLQLEPRIGHVLH